MILRNILFGAAALIVSAAAGAQGHQTQKLVLSKTIMKSLAAHKSKSKTPLTAKVGMIRNSSRAGGRSAQAAPTSVRQIAPVSTRK